MSGIFNPDREYFIVDSRYLEKVRTKLYGYFIYEKGIVENDNLTLENKDKMYGCGGYVYVENNQNEIVIKQDMYACYGIYVFQNGTEFVFSNSLQYLVDYLKDEYELTINRHFVNHLFSMDLASYTLLDTFYNEICLLPNNAIVNITIDNPKWQINFIDYEENQYSLDSIEGTEILDKWFFRWTNVIKNMALSTNNLFMDLSGEFDSRLVVLLAIKAGIDLNKVAITSLNDHLHTHDEDFAIASAIAQKFGFRLNNYEFVSGKAARFTTDDNINMCFYNRLYFHKEMRYKQFKYVEKRYRFGGSGGESVRAQFVVKPEKLVDKFIQRCNKYSPELSETIKESVRRTFGDSFDEAFKNLGDLAKETPERLSLYLHTHGRGRAHFGTGVVENIFANEYDMSPLMDPDLRKIKLTTDMCQDSNLLMAVIYKRFCPELLEFPYEGGRKIADETVSYAEELCTKYPLKMQNYAEDFQINCVDKELSEMVDNELQNPGTKQEFEDRWYAMFSSKLVRDIFCSEFPEELYEIAQKHYETASWYPLREGYPIIACVKALIDAGKNEMKSAALPAESMKSII